MENVALSVVLSGHVRMLEMKKQVRAHRAQKKKVLEKSLANEREGVPTRKADVDLTDLVKAANLDQKLGWKLDLVIDVSPCLHSSH